MTTRATKRGSAYVFDTLTDTRLRKLYAPSATGSGYFGGAVAVWGNNAVVGSIYDNDIAQASGAAYLFRSLVASSPLVSIARKGDAASGTQDAEFSSFTNAFINDNNEGMIQATLAGPGGVGVSGVWTTLRRANSLDLLLRSQQKLDSVPVPISSG